MASQPLQEILLASSPDGSITAYDASSGTTLARFSGSRSPRKGLAIVGSNLIAASHVSSSSSSSNNAIHLYNWWSSAPAHHLPVTEPVGPLVATFDGSYLFAGGLSGHIHALSLPLGNAIQSFSAHSKAVSCLAINHDGSLLFSGGDDGIVALFPIFKIIDSTQQQQQQQQQQLVFRRFVGHESTVTSIATGIGASNCTIISCSLDCTCKFWSLMHGAHLRTIAFPCMIWGVEMDPTESEFYVAGSDGSVYSGALKAASRSSIPSEEQRLVTWGQKHGGAVTALAIMNGGRNLATASELDGNIWIWEVSSKRVIKEICQELVTNISELVVANNQFGDIGRARGDDNRFGGACLGLIPGNTPPVMEMEQVLGALARDRREAFNALGSAIESYEKLLELILKEAARRKDDSDDDTG